MSEQKESEQQIEEEEKADHEEMSDSLDEDREDEPVSKKQKILGILGELLIYAAIIVICLVFVPRYVMQRTIVDGTSMEKTLQDEDNLLVDKLSYHFGNPKRFDVIVFYPFGREKEDYYIKRVIGLPGETIQIVGDVIYINGKVLKEDYGKDPMTESGIAADPLKLGDDEYFVLGDNREISEDSRYQEVGPVSRDKIEGRAVLRIYPFRKFGVVSSFGQNSKRNFLTTSVRAKELSGWQEGSEIQEMAVSPVAGSNRKAGQRLVAIDAGHQRRGNYATEPIGPGSSTKKPKVSSGTSGVSTHVPEYKLNLAVAKKLRKQLLARGYQVYMIRTKHDVNLSNIERAKKANKSGADIYIRIHADGSASSATRGASVLYPSRHNRYVGYLSKKSERLSKCLINAYCKRTGIRNRGLSVRDDLTGTNWSKIPVALLEMGFMSNPTEDRLMEEKAFQKKMAAGMADGVDAYFEG